MVNLKNNNVVVKNFVLFLTFLFLLSCRPQKEFVTKIEGKKIPVTEILGQSAEIESYVKPYRDTIEKDLSAVLAYAPVTLDKSGEWQSTFGNLFSDVTKEKGNFVFNKRENKAIDFVLLNNGGIRSILPKGNVITRTAYEIMPFENSLVVVALKGEQVQEMVDYFIAEKKPHPLSGMTFTITADNNSKNILINGKPLSKNTIYYVGTNDYLANGGDNMIFFKKGVARYDLEYKLRNVLIDYFKEVDTIPIVNDIRIIKE